MNRFTEASAAIAITVAAACSPGTDASPDVEPIPTVIDGSENTDDQIEGLSFSEQLEQHNELTRELREEAFNEVLDNARQVREITSNEELKSYIDIFLENAVMGELIENPDFPGETRGAVAPGQQEVTEDRILVVPVIEEDFRAPRNTTMENLVFRSPGIYSTFQRALFLNMTDNVSQDGRLGIFAHELVHYGQDREAGFVDYGRPSVAIEDIDQEEYLAECIPNEVEAYLVGLEFYRDQYPDDVDAFVTALMPVTSVSPDRSPGDPVFEFTAPDSEVGPILSSIDLQSSVFRDGGSEMESSLGFLSLELALVQAHADANGFTEDQKARVIEDTVVNSFNACPTFN